MNINVPFMNINDAGTVRSLSKINPLIITQVRDLLHNWGRFIYNICLGAGQLRGRAFAHGAMGRRIDTSWGGPIELFIVPSSAPRLV